MTTFLGPILPHISEVFFSRFSNPRRDGFRHYEDIIREVSSIPSKENATELIMTVGSDDFGKIVRFWAGDILMTLHIPNSICNILRCQLLSCKQGCVIIERG